MTIPLLSEVFSNTGHLVEEHQFTALCPRCNQTCRIGEIQSIQSEDERTYHCPGCMTVVVIVSDPTTTPASGQFYRIAGWALRPLAALSIALEVSAITVPPVRSVTRNPLIPGRGSSEWQLAHAFG